MKTSDSSPENKSTHIEPQNKKGLVQILGVSMYILNRMLEDSQEEIGEPTGTMYCQKQVQYMINKYGIMEK
ncbi:MAG: hypothetical protein H0U95_15460 [Bacteroidetes bacterium]|nr:hypothetical protein [Bacteroidota bacterium]